MIYADKLTEINFNGNKQFLVLSDNGLAIDSARVISGNLDEEENSIFREYLLNLFAQLVGGRDELQFIGNYGTSQQR
jgi:hypothetical protein